MMHRHTGMWDGIIEGPGPFGYRVSRESTAEGAIAVLDRDYPMEKQHGEK